MERVSRPFLKMNGLGNDFVVVEARSAPFKPTPDEVRAIADHWRGQGTPDYISAVTEEPLEGAYEIEGAPTGPDDPETQVYRRAVQLVVENRKASTSWLQRQLRIGYNRAARHIERMEKDGLVSRPDHVGRREVLMDTEGRPLN